MFVFLSAREFRECVMHASRPVSAVGLWVTTWFSGSNFFFLHFFLIPCLWPHESTCQEGRMKHAMAPFTTTESLHELHYNFFFCHKQNFPNVAAFLCVLTCTDPADENKNIRATCRLVLRAWHSIWRGTWLAGKPDNTNTHKAWGLLLQLEDVKKNC